MARFCRHCGAPVKENMKFCTSCGQALQGKPPENENLKQKPIPMPTPVPSTSAVQAMAPTPRSAPTIAPPPPPSQAALTTNGRSNQRLYIVVAAVLLALAAGGGYYFYQANQQQIARLEQEKQAAKKAAEERKNKEKNEAYFNRALQALDEGERELKNLADTINARDGANYRNYASYANDKLRLLKQESEVVAGVESRRENLNRQREATDTGMINGIDELFSLQIKRANCMAKGLNGDRDQYRVGGDFYDEFYEKLEALKKARSPL